MKEAHPSTISSHIVCFGHPLFLFLKYYNRLFFPPYRTGGEPSCKSPFYFCLHLHGSCEQSSGTQTHSEGWWWAVRLLHRSWVIGINCSTQDRWFPPFHIPLVLPAKASMYKWKQHDWRSLQRSWRSRWVRLRRGRGCEASPYKASVGQSSRRGTGRVKMELQTGSQRMCWGGWGPFMLWLRQTPGKACKKPFTQTWVYFCWYSNKKPYPLSHCLKCIWTVSPLSSSLK